MNIELLPFTVPNFVISKTKPGLRQDGFNPSPSFPLSQVDARELSAMCDTFRAEVFNKAGKIDPRTEEQPTKTI